MRNNMETIEQIATDGYTALLCIDGVFSSHTFNTKDAMERAIKVTDKFTVIGV